MLLEQYCHTQSVRILILLGGSLDWMFCGLPKIDSTVFLEEPVSTVPTVLRNWEPVAQPVKPIRHRSRMMALVTAVVSLLLYAVR
jgi:hypothetical protein